MALNLNKGSRFNLAKEAPKLKIAGIGLGWDPNEQPNGPDFDLEMLGLKNFTIEPPNFEPGSLDDQGKLDEKKPVQCPNCGEQFVPE